MKAVRESAILQYAPEHAAALAEAEKALHKVERAGARLLADISPRLAVWENPDSDNIKRLEALSNGNG